MKQSQQERILAHLKSGKSIAPLGALQKFGCLRLSARIWNLIKNGHSIKKRMVGTKDKRWAMYYM